MKILAFIRSLLASVLYPFVILLVSFFIVLFGAIPSARAQQDWVVGLWAKVSLRMFGVKVKTVGLENLPAGGYVALFNHTSNFDILAIQSLIPRIRFGAKIELFKIPVFGHAMTAAKALPIARSQRTAVLKVYDEAKIRLQKGECFILAPEGTRQKHEKLGAFKSGPFLFAITAQVPLVPIALKGASKVQPKGAVLPNSHQWSSTIEVIIGKPISTIGIPVDDKKVLQGQVFDIMRGLGLD